MGGATTQAAGSVSGRCLCGALRFELILPTKWCAHCHCRMCQRAHGTALVTWVGVAESHFRLLHADSLVWYRSSPPAQRGFCNRCGSTVFFRSERWPGEVHVTLANLDGPIDRAPKAHVYYDSHVDWLELGDELRRIAEAGNATGGEG